MEVEQSLLAVELEPTDHVCVLYLLWTSLVFCMPSGPSLGTRPFRDYSGP